MQYAIHHGQRIARKFRHRKFWMVADTILNAWALFSIVMIPFVAGFALGLKVVGY